MPFGLGYWSKFDCISIAFVFKVGKLSNGAGWCPKRKLWRSGQNLPSGSIKNGIRSMFDPAGYQESRGNITF